MGIILFSYFLLNKVFFNASQPFFIVFRYPLTPPDALQLPSIAHQHIPTPPRHPWALTHPLLFPIYRILGHTHCRRLLMPRCRALALSRRSLTRPHCPLMSPCLPLLPLDHPLMPLWCPLTLFRCPLMPARYLLTHPVTVERILLALLCLPITF